MADELLITPQASAAQTASGSGSAIDLQPDGVELRRSAQLLLVVAAVSAGASLTVTVQTSPDGTTWSNVDSFQAVTAASRLRRWFGDFERYVRVSWVITGTLPSVTFSVAGKAVSNMCSDAELMSIGFVAAILEAVPIQDRIEQCVAADGKVRGYLLRHANTA